VAGGLGRWLRVCGLQLRPVGEVPAKAVLPKGGAGFPQQFPAPGFGLGVGHVLLNGEDDLVDDGSAAVVRSASSGLGW
jgi:hypothetical protein